MDLMDKIYAQAKANPQTVAFPEADDPKMMQAVNEAVSAGYCKASEGSRRGYHGNGNF